MRTNLNSLIIERLRAELRTIPRARITLKQQVNAPRASVLVPFCLDSGVPSVLFTKRPSTMSNHPGQVAFPGGKIDDSDQNEADAALRELFEEVGIERQHVDVLGMLPDAVARSKRQTVVTPVIGFLKSDLTELELVWSQHIYFSQMNRDCVLGDN
jgi:8-oxo-dGTP pyrophosphatase MutT (NUDIX family)